MTRAALPPPGSITSRTRVLNMTHTPISPYSFDDLIKMGILSIAANTSCVHADGTVVACHNVGGYGDRVPATNIMVLEGNDWVRYRLIHSTADDSVLPGDDGVVTKTASLVVVRRSDAERSTSIIDLLTQSPAIGRMLIVDYRQSPQMLANVYGSTAYILIAPHTAKQLTVKSRVTFLNPNSLQHIDNPDIANVLILEHVVYGDDDWIHCATCAFNECTRPQENDSSQREQKAGPALWTVVVPKKRSVLTKMNATHFAVARIRQVRIYRIVVGITGSLTIAQIAGVEWKFVQNWREDMMSDMRYVDDTLIIASDTTITRVKLGDITGDLPH